MKKITGLLVLLFLGNVIYAQVTRAELAIDIYHSLFSNGADPNDNVAAEFQNPYLDLQGSTSSLIPYVNAMCHLEFGDGRSVFDRNTILFLPDQFVSRGEMVRVVMEGFNLPIANEGDASPFNDVPDPFFSEYYHIVGAWQAGIIPTTTNFFPYDPATPSFYLSLFNNITANYSTPSVNELNDLANYFIPNNYQPDNIGFLRGLEQGVFSHYAKNSFVIPDIKFNLNFSHYYSTQLVELSESYFPVKPLGRGWTHTYNSYVQRDQVDGHTVFYIVWADGTIHIWDDTELEYITKGVYNNFTYAGDEFVRIRTKDQTRYSFEQLNDDLDIFYLREIEDSNENIIQLFYESAEETNKERITTVRAPSGSELDFYYHDNTDFIDYIEDPIGRQIRFTYDEERLKYFYDAKDQETKYYYVSNDEDAPDEHQYKRFLLRRIRLPEGNNIRAEYDDEDNGKIESYLINDIATNIDVNYSDVEAINSTMWVPMPDGDTQEFNYEFNAEGMVSEFHNDTQDINITYPDPTDINALSPESININGLEIGYGYDDRGNITSIQVEDNDDEDFWYDNNNNLIQYRDENDNNTYFNYDGNDNLISIQDALGNFITFDYDSFGQVISITNQEGITVNYTYEDGVVTSISAPEDLEYSFNYDGINRLISQTINGQTSSFVYDPNDNLTSHTNIGGLTTTFDYDANDNLITITNANNVQTSFGYNNEDQVISENFNGLIKLYDYNDDGTLNTYTKPSGNIIEYDYTGDGKLNSKGSIVDVDYYHDDDGKKEGLVSSIASESIRYNLDYDYLNRLDQVQIQNEPNNTINYEYDNVGNITRIYYPESSSNFYVRYIYDAKNRLQEIRVTANGNTNSVILYEYYDDDRLHKIWYPNDIEARYSYDDAGRLIRINHIKHLPGGGNDSMFFQDLELDARGNILSDESFYREQIENEEEQSFSIQEELYNYNGNNHINQAGDNTINVDSDGNTIQKSGINYEYNIDDQLINITGDNGVNNINFHLKYDAYGNRIQKNIIEGTANPETRRYVWDIVNNNVIKEYNPTSTDQYFYVYGVSGVEFAVAPDTGEIIKFYHGDIRGSVVFTSNNDENVIDNHFNKYDDFGNMVTEFVSGVEVYGGFTYLGKYGIVNDVTTQDGLYYIKARYYDAKLGRFLTQDPIWSTNLYPYSNNNPISNIDINGKQSQSYLFRGDPWVYLSYNFSNHVNDFQEYISSQEFLSDVFGSLEVGGDVAFIGGAALTLSGYGTALGISLMTYGGGASTFGSLGNGVLDIYNEDDYNKLGRTVLIEFGSEAYEFLLKKLGVGYIDMHTILGINGVNFIIVDNLIDYDRKN